MFTVLYRQNGTDEARLGLAIAKRRCRLASDRNRLKRIVRESFRQQRRSLPGLDIVVINQASANQADNPMLLKSLDAHWQRCRTVTGGGQ